ncbi:MAG: deoxyribose-phosphate aldolase [Bryobacteraceae bacterium]|nr:deoxyribose-phosphate aldolase [Bryobacteraceae bacterium]
MNNQPDPSRIDRAVAALIDHTILKADATRADVLRICAEARVYGFASVCVNGFWVPLVAAELAGTAVKVCTVVGFPLGAMAIEAKRAETLDALAKGAQEVDMVMNVGALLGGDEEAVREDIALLAQACHDSGAILKVILETCLLTDRQKERACAICVESGANFVKTSTGFSSAGATVSDIALMRRAVGPDLGVKASGGIRTLESVREMVAAGASRIGASASVAIVGATVS